MGYRLSKIYTKTGDSGDTGLGNGERVPKYHLRVEAYGQVDELSSHIGLLRAMLKQYVPVFNSTYDTQLSAIQHELFNVGGELSIPSYTVVADDAPTLLEEWIDSHNALLSPLENFILPAGSMATSQAHVARTVCRRAERVLSALLAEEPEHTRVLLLVYLNRLSDYLFVLARAITYHSGETEVLWERARA